LGFQAPVAQLDRVADFESEFRILTGTFQIKRENAFCQFKWEISKSVKLYLELRTMKFDKKAGVIGGVAGASAGGLAEVLGESLNLPFAVRIVILVIVCAIVCAIAGIVVDIIWK
jgi:hypothetical protein